MLIGFIIWSIVALSFLAIGVSCLRAKEAIGFFTFVKPPVVKEVRRYNRAVAVLWFVAAALMELIGLPLLFAEQNSPIFIFVILAVVALVIGMAIAYILIEGKYSR